MKLFCTCSPVSNKLMQNWNHHLVWPCGCLVNMFDGMTAVVWEAEVNMDWLVVVIVCFCQRSLQHNMPKTSFRYFPPIYSPQPCSQTPFVNSHSWPWPALILPLTINTVIFVSNVWYLNQKGVHFNYNTTSINIAKQRSKQQHLCTYTPMASSNFQKNCQI